MYKQMDVSEGIVQVCKHIPFLPEQLYCYNPVFLSYYDKLFFVVLGAALLATLIGWLQGAIR